MRTTLDIDDDVLQVAKDLAKAADKTAGKIISELARKALTEPSHGFRVEEPRAIYGIKPFPKRPGGKPVTSEFVRQLMDEEGI
ncbi:MAG: CopG family transcriptional regulator [Casimicrobium sp.]